MKHAFDWEMELHSYSPTWRRARLLFQHGVAWLARTLSFQPTDYEKCLHLCKWAIHLHIEVPAKTRFYASRIHEFKNAFLAKCFSFQFEITKFWLLMLMRKIFVRLNNGCPVFFTLTPCFPLRPRVFHQTPCFPRPCFPHPVFSTPRVFHQTPCFPLDPVFSTSRVFHTPCFPHPGTP